MTTSAAVGSEVIVVTELPHVPLKILLIEDNPADARLVKELLREAGPHWVTLTYAERLQEAVGLLQHEGFSAILLDLNLPDSEGFSTFVHAQAEAHDAPIVVFTGSADKDLPLRAIAAGAQDYLIKGKVDGHLLFQAIRYAVERHRIEQSLRTTQARLRQVLTSSPAVLYATRVTTEGFVPIWVSDNIEQVSGYRASEAIGPDWWIGHIHPDDKARVLLQLDRLRREGRLSTEYRFRCVDESYRWFHDDARLRADELGKEVEVFGAWLDITEQKHAESALRESELRFRELAENVREVFFINEPETGQALYLSPAYEAMFGHTREYAYATPNAWLERVHPDDRGRLLTSMASTDAEKPPEEDVFRLLRPDGSVRWIRGRATPVFDESGKLIRVVGIVEDITELRRTQQQLFQSQKLEAVGRLAGGVAHDFNNLLTVIIGTGELMVEDLAEIDPLRENVKEILQAASRAGVLTRQLLAFSRQQVLELRVIDLNGLIGNMDKMLRRVIGEDVELDSALNPELGAVRADSGQLEQVVLNLVVNARDAMTDGGKLTLETTNVELDQVYVAAHEPVRSGSYVMLAVTDTGTGMTETVQASIFEPFFTTKPPGKGTGLGLATVYGIVKQSGGFIWVYSEPGKGTTFKIYLPRVAEAPESPPVRSSAVEPMRGTETILVVEDETMVRSLVRAALVRRGYGVLEAASGGEALLMCEGHPEAIHLLVTDVIMPAMTGPDLAGRLMPLRPGMKVLYMSGYADRAITRHHMLEPGVAFLEKPFTPDSLAHKVRQVLDGN